ncbi:transcriptional regulator [Aurantimonas sp. VKM B-3413]|uniref:HVO_A0114 family putative DNA-binding protein n=1 Tax=Aurantimonas sp. VKM B-3413 TaxID=2779401 RepID=UPI001E2832E3|nr:transcriptional regulator [Aurantimonas sp. VKM B-3413]MCB8837257.1 transcriptional regulator [Aurantimonas sp. VKM B-3413]
MADEKTLVTISVSTEDDVTRRMKAAFAGVPQGNHIRFATPELLWRTLTAKCWEILKAMTGQGPLSIREVARRVGRDVKAVHGDVTALVTAGVIDRSEAGVEFPYDAIHVDFTVEAA